MVYYHGIGLERSSENIIANNTAENNGGCDIWLYTSKNNKLTGNIMLGNGINIVGNSLTDFTHVIEQSNTVNGKPVYYWKDVEGGRIPAGAGQVILTNCTNVIVENQSLNNATIGIDVMFSSDITIRNNNCSYNRVGISLGQANNNSISTNNCSDSVAGISLAYSNNNSITTNNCSNNLIGFFLLGSNNNHIYRNNFINNTDSINSSESTNNIWNSLSKITYTYNGNRYTKYLGNYWDDYEGTDVDGDGIGDSQYSINTDKDIYPLMEKFEHYFQQ